MIRAFSIPVLVLSLGAATLTAQETTLAAFGSPGERAEASLFLARMKGEQFAGVAGAVFITYGVPTWKAEYAEMADELMGKMFRLGKDNWTTFDSSNTVKVGDVTVPAGLYYLAAARDDEGAWSLVFIDPAKAKAAGAWPFAPDPAPRAHEVPLKHETTKAVTEKLSISFERRDNDPTRGELVIAWGNHKVSAAYEVEVEVKGGGAQEAAASKKGEQDKAK